VRIPCLAVLFALLTLRSLAFASPPDPSWLDGIYDGADFDDVVVLAAIQVLHPAPAPPVDVAPNEVVVWTLPLSSDQAAPLCQQTPAHPRAPPSPALVRAH
jgi:hypothetical protein